MVILEKSTISYNPTSVSITPAWYINTYLYWDIKLIQVLTYVCSQYWFLLCRFFIVLRSYVCRILGLYQVLTYVCRIYWFLMSTFFIVLNSYIFRIRQSIPNWNILLTWIWGHNTSSYSDMGSFFVLKSLVFKYFRPRCHALPLIFFWYFNTTSFRVCDDSFSGLQNYD